MYCTQKAAINPTFAKKKNVNKIFLERKKKKKNENYFGERKQIK